MHACKLLQVADAEGIDKTNSSAELMVSAFCLLFTEQTLFKRTAE